RDVRAAARDRLREGRHRTDLQRDRTRDEGGRSGRAGAHAYRRRRERHLDGAPARDRGRGAQADRHARPGRAPRDARLMHGLVPLVVAVPMLAAALLVATGDRFPRPAPDVVAIAAAAAIALTAYGDEPGPLQGALNFAVVNGIAAFFVLTGIALVYARTGALNLEQIGRSLEHRRPDGLVVVAFALLVCGLLTKAGIVPF